MTESAVRSPRFQSRAPPVVEPATRVFNPTVISVAPVRLLAPNCTFAGWIANEKSAEVVKIPSNVTLVISPETWTIGWVEKPLGSGSEVRLPQLRAVVVSPICGPRLTVRFRFARVPVRPGRWIVPPTFWAETPT